MLDTRWGAAAAACALAFLCGTSAFAGAPQLKTQAPGWYRMMLGDFEVTSLSDGTFPMDVAKLLTNITPKQLDEDLSRSFLTNPVEASVNGFLINTGTKLVLIDTGAGTYFGPTVGKLVANLKASGYRPEQVDEIYITHMHSDHIGGLVAGGKMAFPNAVVRASQQEADYWLSKAKMAAVPAEARDSFVNAQKALQPYVAAGRFKPFNGDAQLVPGVRSVATLAVATASFYLVERPIRQGAFFRQWRAWVGTPAAVAAVTIAVVLATGSASVAAVAAPLPVPSAPSSSHTTVLVLGDSTALTLSVGLSYGASRYGASVVEKGIVGCGVAVVSEVSLHGVDSAMAPACRGRSSGSRARQSWAMAISSASAPQAARRAVASAVSPSAALRRISMVARPWKAG